MDDLVKCARQCIYQSKLDLRSMFTLQNASVWRKLTQNAAQPPCPEAEAKIKAVVKFETPGSGKSVTILVRADSES